MYGLRRWIYVAFGGFFVALAFLGAVLPVLPCTPFLLLASYFFVRASPGLNRRLLASPLFGPMIHDWQKHRGVRLHVKVTALSIMPMAVGSSIYFASLSTPMLVVLTVLALVGMYVVMRLPLVRE